MWRLNACERLTERLPRTRKRFLAPDFVFIFGMMLLLSICCLRRCSPQVAAERLWRAWPHRRQAWFRDAQLPLQLPPSLLLQLLPQLSLSLPPQQAPSVQLSLPPSLPPRPSSEPAASPFAGPPASATTRRRYAARDRSEYVPTSAHRTPGAPFLARESVA